MERKGRLQDQETAATRERTEACRVDVHYLVGSPRWGGGSRSSDIQGRTHGRLGGGRGRRGEGDTPGFRLVTWWMGPSPVIGTLGEGCGKDQDTLSLGQLQMLWSQQALNKRLPSECPRAHGPGAGPGPLKA